ncbi:MAG: hypothetical protein C0471_18235 [Erythrobacter sp.]|nr:hypothetical protein [Erythrobacter sp.]
MSPPDASSVIDSLTEKQHEALALAARHLTSKQIAQKLGVAPVTIDKRIEAVRARLGYISRSDLLRLYREWCDDYGRIIDGPIILDQTECPPALPEAPQHLSDLMFHDSLAFDARASWDRGRNLLRPGLTPSELGVGGKLAAMLLGAVAIMMIAVLCMAFVDALMSILAR